MASNNERIEDERTRESSEGDRTEVDGRIEYDKTIFDKNSAAVALGRIASPFKKPHEFGYLEMGV